MSAQTKVTMLAAALSLALSGCASGASVKRIEFSAPAHPDPAVLPLLEGVQRIGVLTATNIEPIKELDIEKVMARLSNGIARKLTHLEDVTVVSQDEILWRVRAVEHDSADVVSPATRQALVDSLELDALVHVLLENLQARVTTVTPTPYGMTSSTGLDLSVKITVSLLNLHTGRIWQQSGNRRDWQPIRLQLFGGPEGERQLLMALGGPLEQFLLRVAPPPRPRVRQFEVGGD